MVTKDGQLIEKIRQLAPTDSLGSRLLTASYVTSLMKAEGFFPAIVGGTAVDTYVSSGFGTSETLPAEWNEYLAIDTIAVHVSPKEGNPRNVLEAAGFASSRPEGGSLRLEGVPYPVDLVGDWYPDDYSQDHITSVHLEPAEEFGLEPARLAGPEDILFDYMESGWDTRHPRDWARALAVAAVMGEHLDLGYLFSKAEWRMEGSLVKPLEKVLRGEPLRVPE